MELLKSQIAEFEKGLAEAVKLFQREGDIGTYLRGIAHGATTIEDGIIALGDYALGRQEEDFHHDFLFLHFVWAEQAKNFLILWRDALMEIEKAEVLRWDGQTDEAAVTALRKATAEVIIDASEELLASLTPVDLLEQEKNVASWKHQKNPWLVYREQLLKIQEQCHQIQTQYKQLKEVAGIFQQLQKAVLELLEVAERENADFVLRAQEVITLIQEALPPEGEVRPGRIAAKLEDISSLMELPNQLEILNQEISQQVATLPEKIRFPMATEGGMVQYRDLALQRSVPNWLEAKVMPVVFEIWEIAEHIRNSMKTTLLNVRNRSSLLAAELKEGKSLQTSWQELSQPLDTFLENAAKWEDEVLAHRQTIERRFEQSFLISNIYLSEEEFLFLPFQSSIKYLTQNQNEFRLRVENSWGQLRRWVQRIRRTVVEEEALSPAEKLIRVIRSRKPEDADSHYTSIFLTKGYIGESFWVGRQSELNHISQLLENFEQGFRGALVLYGQPMSGKSLMGEVIANRFFPRNCIRLQPNSPISLEGRRMTSSYDLEESLEFVRKYSLNMRPLIWIDDLELWRDPQIPLSKNIRHLIHYLNNYADDQFFMISMGPRLKAYLDRYFQLDKVIPSAIRLDRMGMNQILEAIWIRHGATNQKLVDAAGNEVEPQLFRKLVSKIYKASKGNIGEALNRWAYSIKSLEDEKVIFQDLPRYQLPDFLTPDMILMLETFLMNKRLNEYQLRKMFGPAFKTKYVNLLNQLLGVGILLRQLDGWLEVNELIVNDLSRMLDHKRTQVPY